MSEVKKTSTGLPLGSTVAYAIGSSGANVSFYMINNYLMLFYTDIVGLAATAISLIMLIARIWDARSVQTRDADVSWNIQASV